jgi:5'-3' exonuclease
MDNTIAPETPGGNLSANEIVLIDLSSIAHPIWHVSQAEPDPNHASHQIAARVRSLANGHPRVAVCCDSGTSFRKELDPSYKGNRPPAEAMLHHQIDLAKEQLAADGFPLWSVRGFEADDVIASAVVRALAVNDPSTVLIVSADKDLLQLVGDRVRAMNARDGSILDADGVQQKFGVRPDQMLDYLCLVGDASDNIKGATRIGPKTAVELLRAWGSLDAMYEALDTQGSRFTPGVATSLREFRPRLDVTRKLITLRLDVDLPFDEIHVERVPKDVATFAMDVEDEAATDAPSPTPAPLAMAVRPPETLGPSPAEWERQLDPRSMSDARVLAKDMHASRMFAAYGTPQAVLSTVMVGRELGLPAMASLRSIHVVEGRHTLAASLMVALVLKSGLAEYFRPVSFDDKQATFETLRKGEGNQPIRLTHTIEMAQTAQLVKPNSNWVKVPTDMLVARAQSRLARLVYPDLMAGLYTPDELAELREQVA